MQNKGLTKIEGSTQIQNGDLDLGATAGVVLILLFI
jgi:hypothetical protein